MLWDVGLTSPFTGIRSVYLNNMTLNQAKILLRAAAARVEAEQQTYAILGTYPELAAKYEFYPLVFKTSGAIHKGVEQFL